MMFLRKNIGIPIAEKVTGLPVRRYLYDLLKTQWLKPNEIREIQNKKLVALIKHAYETVPFYKKIMDDRGLKPMDIQTVDDLWKFPILTKEIIRANYPAKIISTKFDKSQLIETSSSGSTGEPFRYVLSKDEKARKWAGLYRFWNWAGYEMGDKYVNLTLAPPRAFKSNIIWQFLENRYSGVLGLAASSLYEGNAVDFLMQIVDFKPKMLRGYASSIYYIAQIAREQGLQINVDTVCTTGETLFDFQRESISNFYHCKVYDGYGGEGMEIAAQCGFGNSYHVNAESLILETVDLNGNPCDEGAEGQVVLTNLNHYSMPFIRYNIQDIAILSERQCACGMGLPVLERISGRLTDIGVTPSGKSIVVHFFTGMFMKLAPKVTSFQVVQEKPDLFVLNIVPGDGFDAVKDEIVSKTQDYVGNDVKVELKILEDIPTTKGGKRRLFISKCGLKAAGLDLND